jgi:5-methylthioadenosine/S-adenosylhomocysteine deaminase
MGTLDGAKSIWLNDVGALKAGMKADFIAIDSDRPHFFPKSDYTSHIIYSASGGDVTDVWINGKQTVRGGEVLTLDEEKIKYEFQKRYEAIVGA